MRQETPLDPVLVDELMELWLPIFVEGIDLTREALLGEEMPGCAHHGLYEEDRRKAGGSMPCGVF